MTSFNINQPGKMPQITEAQNMMNNGGGGNTGYLETGRKKKKKKEEGFNPSILAEDGEDKFERSEVEYEDDDDYYNTSPSYSAKSESDEELDDEKEENLNSDNIKNKFLGLFSKIVNNNEDQGSKNVLPSGDFLTISKNKNIEI